MNDEWSDYGRDPRFSNGGSTIALTLIGAFVGLLIIIFALASAAHADMFFDRHTPHPCNQFIPLKYLGAPQSITVTKTPVSYWELQYSHQTCGRYRVDRGHYMSACTTCLNHMFCTIEYRDDLSNEDTRCLIAGEMARVRAYELGDNWDPPGN